VKTDWTEIPIVTMWPGGPQRRFFAPQSDPQPLGGKSVAYAAQKRAGGLVGWAGAYVCDECKSNSDGVYLVEGRWVGGCCRLKVKSIAQ
jgi:hypothetical protein